MSFLSAIHVYPIKSLKGIALDAAKVEQRGLQYDRRWMVVDENDRFITQREHSRMALISVSFGSEGLEVNARGMSTLSVPFRIKPSAPVTVQIFRDTCQALVVGRQASQWFSEFLGTPCKLVYMPDEARRAVDPEYAVGDTVVSFADAYPFLLVGEASLEELNRRLERPLPMNRFRPNFVISGTGAFAEDEWKTIRIGSTLFHAVKSCARCAITTIEQETGVRDGQEPLKTLATFRSANHKVLFGRYLIAGSENQVVKLGDRIEVVEHQEIKNATAQA